MPEKIQPRPDESPYGRTGNFCSAPSVVRRNQGRTRNLGCSETHQMLGDHLKELIHVVWGELPFHHLSHVITAQSTDCRHNRVKLVLDIQIATRRRPGEVGSFILSSAKGHLCCTPRLPSGLWKQGWFGVCCAGPEKIALPYLLCTMASAQQDPARICFFYTGLVISKYALLPPMTNARFISASCVPAAEVAAVSQQQCKGLG